MSKSLSVGRGLTRKAYSGLSQIDKVRSAEVITPEIGSQVGTIWIDYRL
jgi:hypothetical protein